ncbi:MAG: bifunctional phosphoribosylaminoimidazolecarboxamide formyltransferase/IMP cyclohydrolase [Actinobacteria bacterium]|nr:bifunctional phosphoribosylaminoimidazolecarboxamide formyltransferase/IMP cyclohydrolase [Actinomycetota bacterium]MCL6104747.1 bifunctional phosphoribosylaminoimidazolecarboxamide formyltransferase/IMP cyclohydrolase [Actinomycetota bacterium]
MKKRALLSVYDKTGIEQFARGLETIGWELIASGGTSSALDGAGISHIQVETVSQTPEMLDGRLKTLHPAIHGGILADRSKPSHMSDLDKYNITPIDLVICNLYPFGASPCIENIDIGGPTMLRAGAKNYEYVSVVVDPADYDTVLAELQANGETSLQTRLMLAYKTFSHTAAYDETIANWFGDKKDSTDQLSDKPADQLLRLPNTLHLKLDKTKDLRYGENPHLQGALYHPRGRKSIWDSAIQHSGLELSYLNILDADAAWRLVYQVGNLSMLHEPGNTLEGNEAAACVIVKHANPCGVSLMSDAVEAYKRAFESDPVSAFGGIVALNTTFTAALAKEMLSYPKADVVIAPSYESGAIGILAAKRKNTRIIQAVPPVASFMVTGGQATSALAADAAAGLTLRSLEDAYLVQETDRIITKPKDWQVVTRRIPTKKQYNDLEMAWLVCAFVTSNAIVLVKDSMTIGIGAGQPNRVDSARIAIEKAQQHSRRTERDTDKEAGEDAVGASDAFFPFRDGLDELAAAGVTAIVQPGGSIRDQELIAAADEHGIAMVFSNERHFKH